VGGDVPINSETLLMTDFINLKIKPAQPFRGIHMDMVYVYVFIYIYKYLCLYHISKKQYDTQGRWEEN
jgi:hypothetical protein